MPLRVFAVCMLIISILTGYYRFSSASVSPEDQALPSALFICSTICFVTALLRIFSQHLASIGDSIFEDRNLRSD